MKFSVKAKLDGENNGFVNARRRQRRKNIVVMALLFGWVIIMYLVSILRMGGTT